RPRCQCHVGVAVRAHVSRSRHGLRAGRHRQGPTRQLYRRAPPGRCNRPTARCGPHRLAPMTARAAASPDGLPPLGEVIRSLGHTARKSLGQNFILDLNLTRRIARAAGPLQGRTVLEIGPGPGGLTRALFLEGAERVVAVERDERCRPALEAVAQRYPGRLDVHYTDALIACWPTLVPKGASKLIVAANLPYNIATLLLIGWLESEPWPPWYLRMVLMFQREVAQRIVATPGSKAYGRLAVIAQGRTRPRLLFNVKPEAFSPPPAVASSARLVPRPTSPDP